MRSIHPLAVAGVLAALVGCSPAPQAPTTDLARSTAASESSVTLRTQGLLSAKLEAGTITVTKGVFLEPSDINSTLGYLVTKETVLPTGAVHKRYLKQDAQSQTFDAVAEQDATHRFYQFPSLRDEDVAHLNALLYAGGSGTSVPVVMTKTDEGKFWVPFPDSGAYSALVGLKNTAPATLFFQHEGVGMPPKYVYQTAPGMMYNYPASKLALSAKIAVSDAKGNPLSGLTLDHLDFTLLIKTTYGEYQVILPVTLTEPQKGTYQLSATSYSLGNTAGTYVIDLKIKNKPLIHDVDY